MPVFPSDAWMAEFCAHLEAHPKSHDIAGALDGVYRFVVEPGGPLMQRHTYHVAIRPGADGVDAGLVDEDPSPRLSLSADYRRWQQLVRGELDVGMAVMLRRLRVSGDLTSLIGNVSSAEPLLDSLAEVETVWLEDL